MWSNAKRMQGSSVVEGYGRPVRARTADLYRVNVDLKPDKQGKNRLRDRTIP